MKKLLMILLLATVCSCSQDETLVAPDSTGNISGTVILYDGSGNEVVDKSNVKVYLAGTTDTTITNTPGTWSFTNIQAQEYEVVFEKIGYDKTNKKITVDPSATTTDLSALLQPSSAYVSTMILNQETNKIDITGIVNFPNNTLIPSNFVVLFHSNESISAQPGYHTLAYVQKNQIHYNSEISNHRFAIDFQLKTSNVNNEKNEIEQNFASGANVYGKAYMINPATALHGVTSTYTNFATGAVRLNGLGEPSNVVSFVMP